MEDKTTNIPLGNVFIRTKRLNIINLNISNKDIIIIYNNHNYEHFRNAIPEYQPDYLTEEYQTSKIWHEFDLMLRDEAVRFYVFENTDIELSEIIADVGIYQIDRTTPSSCQLSYKTDKNHTGRGIAREAVAALVEYVFSELKIQRIEACVLPDNIASAKVAQACGFTHTPGAERFLKINGKEQNHLIFTIENPHSEDL